MSKIKDAEPLGCYHSAFIYVLETCGVKIVNLSSVYNTLLTNNNEKVVLKISSKVTEGLYFRICKAPIAIF